MTNPPVPCKTQHDEQSGHNLRAGLAPLTHPHYSTGRAHRSAFRPHAYFPRTKPEGGLTSGTAPDYAAVRDLGDLGGSVGPDLFHADGTLKASSTLLPRHCHGVTLRFSAPEEIPLTASAEKPPAKTGVKNRGRKQ
jgi:hypothetical protein